MRFDPRALIPTTPPPPLSTPAEPGEAPLPEGPLTGAPVQIEPDDAPRFTAGSLKRSLDAGTLDLLPPAQAIVNTTPPEPPAVNETET